MNDLHKFWTQKTIKASENGELPSRIEILATGEWRTPWHGDFVITRGDLMEYKANFDSGRYSATDQLPINYEHRPGEAAGWITAVEVVDVDDERSVLMADVEWTPTGAEKLKNREFRLFSPEFSPLHVNPENRDEFNANVLEGGALTNTPLFKSLQSIMANDINSGSNKPSDLRHIYVKGSNQMKLEDILKKAANEVTQDERDFLQDNIGELSTEQVEAFGLEADANGEKETKDAKETKDTKDANENAEGGENEGAEEAEETGAETPEPVAANQDGTVTVKASELNALKRQAEQGASAYTQLQRVQASEYTKTLLAGEQNGFIKRDSHDEVTDFYMGLSEDQQKEFKSIMANAVIAPELKGEKGSEENGSNATAYDQITIKATEKMEKDSKLTYGDAIKQVRRENPELAKQYDNESKGDK